MKRRFPDPWLLGALAWGTASFVVLLEYRRIGGQPDALSALWLLLSLLWGQFAFAAIFADWRKCRGRNLKWLLVRAILPPLLLHVVVFHAA